MGPKPAGIAVHIGARVLGEAEPGEVLVSRTVKDLVGGSGNTFEDRGEHSLKGVPGPGSLFAVLDERVVEVRRRAPTDEAWIRSLLDERWGGPEQVANGESYRPTELPGLLARIDGAIVGYAALRDVGNAAEIGLIESLRPRTGVGSALMDALVEEANVLGRPVLRAVTTDDNVVAQAFYRASGFRLVETRFGAVDQAASSSRRSRRRPVTARRSTMNWCSNEFSERKPAHP